MSKSRSRLAADWFARLRLNATTQVVEHEDVVDVETDLATTESVLNTTISTQVSTLENTVNNTVATQITNLQNQVNNIVIPDEVIISANAPSTSEGQLWFDTVNDILMVSDGTAWLKVSPEIPSLLSIQGSITKATSGNLTLTGINFLSNNLTVKFIIGGSTYTVSVTPTNDTRATVAVPSQVYNGAVDDVVNISVTNSDQQESGSLDLQVQGRTPTLSSVSGNMYSGQSTTLTLTGTNFLSSTLTVNFSNGSTATATSVTSTTASVVVPSGVTSLSGGSTVNITVTNVDGKTSNSRSKTLQALPTGGTITSYGNYRVHTFTSSGNFVVPSGFSVTADVLRVAGGGAGGGAGGNDGAGGGGAGGYLASTGVGMSAGTYTATIGGGAGRAGSRTNGGNGGNTSFSGLSTAIGGGGGSSESGNRTAGSGGSGGGAGGYSGSPGQGTSGQGYRGGDVNGGGSSGGGGGASEQGDTNSEGYGGDGKQNSWRTGSAQWYAGGGGGSGDNRWRTSGSPGGAGGGGTGAADSGGSQASSGSANTGGGGGGASGDSSGYYTSGAGGSGIVVVRYQI
jgi:hypothetical protein